MFPSFPNRISDSIIFFVTDGQMHFRTGMLLHQIFGFSVKTKIRRSVGFFYRFDFRPDSATTLGVGQADIDIARQYPTDRYGVDRLTNNAPDIGAYEFVPEETE